MSKNINISINQCMSGSFKGRKTEQKLVVLLLNCIQLTSQEFDCVYEII